MTSASVHAKLYQTIFPSVFYQQCFKALARIDRSTGQLLTRLMHWSEKTFFGGWDDMHRLRFDQPEEDDGFFVSSFVTEAVYLLFPTSMNCGRRVLPMRSARRHGANSCAFIGAASSANSYANGPGKTVLSKATQSSGSVESLLEAFPDAKFITIIRHPYQSVPSHVSVFYPVWRAHSPEIAKDGPVSKSYARLAVKWYQHLFEFRSKVPPSQYYCLDYRNLTQDPKAVVEKLYQHFGWTMSEAFRARLAAASHDEREFQSQHHYTLEEFGLSKEWIQEELGPLLDHYSLAR